MRPMRTRLSVVLFLVAVWGCGDSQPQLAPPKPPEVLVAEPVRKEITEYEDFTGRTEAEDMIQLRARVTGYLEKANFKDGADVKEGTVLFEIDPSPYAAELERTQANVVQAEARL